MAKVTRCHVSIFSDVCLTRQRDCDVLAVGNMPKDIGMGVHKGTVVSFVPTLFGYFFGGGRGYRAIDAQYIYELATQVIGSDDS